MIPLSTKTSISPVLDRREAVLRHYPYIDRVARRMAKRMPARVALEDVISAGLVGLLESVDRYDPRRADAFDTYAEYRIKGAIMDALRAADHLSRDQRACKRAMREARLRLWRRYGRAPEPEEMATELGCELDRYFELRARLLEARPVRLTPRLLSSRRVSTEEGSVYLSAAYTELRTTMARAITHLPKRLRDVISLYYYEDLNLTEIGQILGVTESRVSQLRTTAMGQLRALLDG